MRRSRAYLFAALIVGVVGLSASAGARSVAPVEPAASAADDPRSDPQAPLDASGCVAIALRLSAQIAEAEAKVAEYKGRLAEVESIFYPKLTGLAWVAPMFTVEGSAVDPIKRDYSPSAWGPYMHLEAVLAQPLYTFGRAAAGKRAASGRAEVERARLEATRHAVAQEVRKFYYLTLFARSMQPSLGSAAKMLAEAQEHGQKAYDRGTGEVTQTDLMKLAYGAAELQRYQLEASMGAELALAGLKHTMGLAADRPLVLADKRLPKPPPGELPPLDELQALASKQRPEWQQVRHGKVAAAALAEAERKALWPVLFAAGMIEASWTPTRDNTTNPYHYDLYNDLTGGVAVGFLFDLDPALASARAEQAEALLAQVEALGRYAATGIPTQVRKAYDDVRRLGKLVVLGKQGVKAARKWMTFGASGYLAGTGEARDLLEGLVAYLSAKRNYYEQLQQLHVARGELAVALGQAELDQGSAQE